MADVVGDIRSLSSGTVSKLLRDAFFDQLRAWRLSRFSCRRTLTINPLLSADSYIVDRIQYAFMMFAAGSDQRFESWQDAWQAYLKRMEDVYFKVSYMGAAEYTIRGFSRTIEYKSHASRYEASTYNGDEAEFQRAVVGKVGCCAVYYGATENFPPNNISCLFPLYTPAMWKDGWVMHPDWPKAKTGEGVVPGDICAYHHDKQFQYTADQWEEWTQFAVSDRSEAKEELRELCACA